MQWRPLMRTLVYIAVLIYAWFRIIHFVVQAVWYVHQLYLSKWTNTMFVNIRESGSSWIIGHLYGNMR